MALVRVLVADDSTTIQKVIRIALSRYDIETVSAISHVEAVSELAKRRADIIIADASLPGSTHPQDYRRLSDASGGCPVLILAGSYDTVDMSQFEALGLRYVLKKPFESMELLQRLTELFGRELPVASVSAKPAAVPPPPSAARLQTPPPPPQSSTPPPPAAASTVPPPPQFRVAPEWTAPPPPPSTMAGSQNDQTRTQPLPVIDQTKRGQRAFSLDDDGAVPMPPVPPVVAQPPAPPAISREGAESMLREELERMVRQSVEEYCERHFAELARDVIAKELRRLADERARFLVDQ